MPKTSADPTTRLYRRGLVWLGCIGLLIVVVAAGLAPIFGRFSSIERFKNEDRKAVAAAEASGIAATRATYNRKYPATERGKAAVRETARIAAAISGKFDDLSTASIRPIADIRTTFPLQWILTNTRGSGISTDTLLAYAAANTTPIADLLKISAIAPYHELGWQYESFSDTPLLWKPSFLTMREASRVLLPTEIFLALQDEDTTRAYEIILNWMYFDRTYKVSAITLIQGMIGVALDGIVMLNLDALLRTSPPPSVGMTERLYEQLDSSRMGQDFARSYEGECITFTQYLRFAAGATDKAPGTFAGGSIDLDHMFTHVFQDEVKEFAKEVSKGHKPSRIPNPLHVSWGLKSVQRRYVFTALQDDLESCQRLVQATFAPDLPTSLKLNSDTQTWAEQEAMQNPCTAIALPAFLRASMNVRGRQALAAVLQAASMVRLAELRSDRAAKMPESMEEVSLLSGKPIPLDPLGATSGTRILYRVHPENGTYVLTHAPSRPPYEGATPFQFRGTWRPGQ